MEHDAAQASHAGLQDARAVGSAPVSLNWDDLKIVLAIARAGSLSKAAVVLGIDQSTAGRRLTALEADLGVILFTRSKTGFTPTQAGDAVILRAGEIERRIDFINEDLRQDSDGPAGRVRILGNSWMLARLTATTLPDFLAEHPKIDMRLITRRPETPARGDATVSLWFEAAPLPGEFAIKLGDVPYSLYAPDGADPAELDWVSFFDEDAPRRAPVRTFERMKKRGERLRLTGSDAGLLLVAVQRGVGKALLPDCIAADSPGIMRVGKAGPALIRTLHLHAHPDTVQTLRVQATVHWLRSSFQSVFAAGLAPDHVTLAPARRRPVAPDPASAPLTTPGKA